MSFRAEVQDGNFEADFLWRRDFRNYHDLKFNEEIWGSTLNKSIMRISLLFSFMETKDYIGNEGKYNITQNVPNIGINKFGHIANSLYHPLI